MKSQLTIFFRSVLATAFVTSASSQEIPEDLFKTILADKDVTPCPACVCASPTGEVFVGVDLQGSLGREPGKGRIVKLIDSNKDGKADSHTVFAEVDNPRGLIAMGDKLYVLHTIFNEKKTQAQGMNLSLFIDANDDGVADGPAKPLVENLSSSDILAKRGTDHSTNGIRMGIDGWIYIAVGDYGFANALDREGTKLTLLGGGVVRVRPDGTELEVYTTGTRNIYDVAIDPFMNIFTRGNTNDGGGWNVRFIHHIQSAAYGYPCLFQNFPGDILPALTDVGGGSGVGALYLDEPGWPKNYNKQPLMADWGKQQVFIHEVKPSGATFTQEHKPLLSLPQITDLDVDASGQMFLTAWDGAGYTGNPDKGFTVRVVPKNWKYKEFPDLSKSSEQQLLAYLGSSSATARLAAQQAILDKKSPEISAKIELIIQDENKPLEARVAALFTFAQLTQEKGISKLLGWADNASLAEFAVRAAADRLKFVRKANVDATVFTKVLESGSVRAKAAAIVALGRLGKAEAALALLKTPPSPNDRSASENVAAQLIQFGGDKAQSVELDVKNAKFLSIEIQDDSDGQTINHVVLGNPVITMEDGSQKNLGDLKWDKAKSDTLSIQLNKNPDGSELSTKDAEINKNLKHGIGIGTASRLEYTLPKGAVAFSCSIAYSSKSPVLETLKAMFASKNVQSDLPLHCTPDSTLVLPHLAAKSLALLNANKSCLEAIGTPAETVAFAALRQMHNKEVVDGLLDRSDTAKEPTRSAIIKTLARLSKTESPFDGSWWWTTRPDTRGPYYKPIDWSESARIRAKLEQLWDQGDSKVRHQLTSLNDSHRLEIVKFGTYKVAKKEEEVQVDLTKIASEVGAIGKTPIEDIIISLEKLKGDPAVGKTLFTRQGCIACHATDPDSAAKGPYMGQIGSIMNRQQIAVAILRPNDAISQGFQTTLIKTKDGKMHMGFVTERNADELSMRDIAGQVTKVSLANVEKEDHMPQSMMPEGLTNSLTLEEFASMVEYLSQNK